MAVEEEVAAVVVDFVGVAVVALMVNSVKADPEAAKVFAGENVVENVFAAENGFAVETTARGAVTAAASGTEGGTVTA